MSSGEIDGPRATQWRLTVTIARRVILGRGRRALRLVALFAAPAFLLTVGNYTITALVRTPTQQAQHLMGAATGVLLSADKAYADPVALIRSTGVRAARYEVQQGRSVYVDGVERGTGFWVADWSDTLLRSRWQLHAGRWPAGPNEVALSDASMAATKTAIGEQLRLGGRGSPVRVVGWVREPADLDVEMILAAPGLLATFHKNQSGVTTFVGYLLTGRPSDVAAVVAAAQKAGRAALTRAGVESEQSKTIFRRQALSVTAPGLLLVVALSAAAFVVRVRRAGRQLSILLAIGVASGTLVRAARLAALVAALTGSALGVLVGAAANAVLAPHLGRATGHLVGIGAVSVPTILLTVAIVSLAAVAAAWLPTRAARRGAAGFDGSPPTPQGRPLLSALLAGGLGLSLAAGLTTHAQAVAIPAFVIATLAAIALVPILLRGASAGSARLPILVRIGLRQIARDVRRPIAAASIGLILMMGSAGTITYYSSLRAVEAAADAGSTHLGTASVPLRSIGPTPGLINDLRAAAGPNGRVATSTSVVVEPAPRGHDRLDVWDYHVVDARGDLAGTLASVASPDDFEGVAGRPPSAREWRAITAGQLLRLNGPAGGRFTVNADPRPAPGPATTVISTRAPGDVSIVVRPNAKPAVADQAPAFIVTAVQGDPVADLAHTSDGFLVGPAFLRAHHLLAWPVHLKVWVEGHVDGGLGDRVRRVAQDHGIAANEVIFHSSLLGPLPFDWRLVVLTGMVLLWIGVGLAVLAMTEDARPFYQSLYALGLTPRQQRIVLITQAMSIAALAAALGTGLGLAVGAASVHADGVAVSLGRGAWAIVVLVSGAVIGAGLLAGLQRGQRAIDELSS